MTYVKTNSNKFQWFDYMTGEVHGGIDGGCEESLTNLQERVSKRRNLQGAQNYNNIDLRALENPKF